MKKLLIGLAIVVLLLVVIAVAAPFFIPAGVYKDQLVAQVKSATGRDLRIDGPVQVSILPRIAIEAEKVSLSNAPGAAEKDMATLAKLAVQLQVLPLLSGEVAVDRFVLVEPVIHLEVDKRGRPNWQFDTAGGGEKTPAPKDAAGKSAAPALQELRLGEVKIENGRITYLDQRSNARHEASEVDLAVKLPSLDAPVNIDGALVWRGKRVQLTAKADRARALLESASTPISVKLAAEPVSLGFVGTAALPALSGDVQLDVPSVRALAEWVGTPLPDSGSGGLGPFSLSGKLNAKDGKYAFADARLALDQIKATGAVEADTTGKRPRVAGKLAVENLDLNPYLGPETGPASKPGAPADKSAPPAASGWSEEPIELAALHAADADLDLSATGIRYRKITVDKGAVKVRLADGKLAIDLTDLALYKGQGTGKVTIEDRKDRPALALSFKLGGIQAEPLLRDAASFERLTGTGSLEFDVAGSGKSQREIVGSLDGKGALSFTDGAIKGINIAAMVRNITSAFDPSAAGTQQTDFSELAGTFTIAKGILSNNDLVLKSPLLRVEGAGKVDLPRRTVDYRVTPKAVASLEGQGGRADLSGIMVPVIVRGPWDNLSYQPDLGAAIGQQLKDPGSLLQRIPGVQAPGTSGAQQPAPAEPKSPAPKPGDLLRGLLNKN
ncbi:MAG: AsmA family protein [Rhodospirillales bacterium]|nr:AsmA family protein [Rhodospirillales bacterium]